jgi:sec-independent protein translocase protein TatC
MVPLYALYEVAILAIRVTHWRRRRKEAVAGPSVHSDAENNEGPEAPPGGGRVGGSGPI